MATNHLDPKSILQNAIDTYRKAAEGFRKDAETAKQAKDVKLTTFLLEQAEMMEKAANRAERVLPNW